MTRMRWVKLHTQETLFGTTRHELEPAERSLWFDFLCLAGDSPEPGVICVAPGIPHTDDQLCHLLNVPPALLKRATDKMLKAGKLEHRDGCPAIVNWTRYQADYERVRLHRERVSNVTPTPPVTKVTAPLDKTRQDKTKTTPDKTVTSNRKRLHQPPANPHENYQRVADLYAASIGDVTTAVGELLNDMAGKHPLATIEAAFAKAVENGVPKLPYIKAILRAPSRNATKTSRQPKKLPTAEQLQAGWGGDAQ